MDSRSEERILDELVRARAIAIPMFGVIDWTRLEHVRPERCSALPRYTAVTLVRPTTPHPLNCGLVSRHRTLAAAQAFADKLNADPPRSSTVYPTSAE